VVRGDAVIACAGCASIPPSTSLAGTRVSADGRSRVEPRFLAPHPQWKLEGAPGAASWSHWILDHLAGLQLEPVLELEPLPKRA